VPEEGGVLGRATRSDICIDHSSVSRRHAKLCPQPDGGWAILDLGSRNGLIVQSRRVDKALLKDGDMIQIGDVVLLWQFKREPVPEEFLEGGLSASESTAALKSEDLQSSPGLSVTRGGEAEARSSAHPEEQSDSGEAGSADQCFSTQAVEELPGEAAGGDRSKTASDQRKPLEPSTNSPLGWSGRSPDQPTATTSPRSPRRSILLIVGLVVVGLIGLRALSDFQSDETPDLTMSNEVAKWETPTPIESELRRPLASPHPETPAAKEQVRELLFERLLAVSPEVTAVSWSAATYLFGRAPAPAEILFIAEKGTDQFLAQARGLPEHWRHRARSILGDRYLNGDPLPTALLPEEVPLDLNHWREVLEQHLDSMAESHLPLPDRNGRDEAFEISYRKALSQPWKIAGWAGAIRSVWTAGGGRPLREEDEDAISRVSASGLPRGELLRRFLILMSRTNPMFSNPPYLGREVDWSQLAQLLPPLGAENPWPADGIEAGVPPALWWATALEHSLPEFPQKQPTVGPLGALRIEILTPFPVQNLLNEPARIPRLWRRLEQSRLTICAPDLREAPESSPQEIFREMSVPLEREIAVLSEGVGLDDGRENPRSRVADGYLIPEFGAIAETLNAPIPRGALPERAARWLLEARCDGERPGERLFRAGGYHLVPGEWRSAAYRPVTRALLLAGAHLIEDRGTDVAVSVTLDEEPRGEQDGEWAEWMTALELISGHCENHPISVWFVSPSSSGGSEGLGVEWGPEIRRGWVIQESEPLAAVHPLLQRDYVDPTDQDPLSSPGDEPNRATNTVESSSPAAGEDDR